MVHASQATSVIAAVSTLLELLELVGRAHESWSIQRFFDAAGYEDSGLVVQVEVSERMRKGEMRPHILLQKRLRSDDEMR